MSEKKRHNVSSIEISNPVEVKFLDNQAHDIVLVAEQEAREAISNRQKELNENEGERGVRESAGGDDTDADDSVELLQTIEEKGDQRIKRRIETKTFVSEDPTTKSKVTKVTKTETTEVTKVYLIRTDEDARNAALELGVPDMSRILVVKEGTHYTREHGEPVLQRLSWKHPRVVRSSLRRSGDTPTSGYESEVLTTDLGSVPQGEFILVSSDGTAISQEPTGSRRSFICSSPCRQAQRTHSVRPSESEHRRPYGLCSCAGGRRKTTERSSRGKKDTASTAVTPIKKKEARSVSIRERIQETTQKFSAQNAKPLVSDRQKVVIEKQNLQLATFIFDLLSKIGVYHNEEEQNRGRKVISRGLDLLYFDRCHTWPEFVNQLWMENEEYSDTNQVVVPTANVIEYIMTSYPDLIGLIDSVPDDRVLGDATMFSERPFVSMKSADTFDESRHEDDHYRSPTKVEKEEHVERDSQQSIPTANLLTIISDHDQLIPKHTDRDGTFGGDVKPSKQLPDVISSQAQPQHANICGIIEEHERLPKERTPKAHRRPICGSKCLACFGERSQKPKEVSTKREKEPTIKVRRDKDTHKEKAGRVVDERKETRVSGKTRSESQMIEIPAVQWPTIGVGQPIMYDTPDIILVDKGKPFKKHEVQKNLVETVSEPKEIVAEVYADEYRGAMPDITTDHEIDSDIVKAKLAETLDILETRAKDISEPALVVQQPTIEDKPGTFPKIDLQKPMVVAEHRKRSCSNIRHILECHQCLPKRKEHAPKHAQVVQKDSPKPSAIEMEIRAPEIKVTDVEPKVHTHSNIRNIIECHPCLPKRKVHAPKSEPVVVVEAPKPYTEEVKISTPDVKVSGGVEHKEPTGIAGIVTCHKSVCCRSRESRLEKSQETCPRNICDLIRYHDSLPPVSRGDYSLPSQPEPQVTADVIYEAPKQRKVSLGGVCTRCFALKAAKPAATEINIKSDVKPDTFKGERSCWRQCSQRKVQDKDKSRDKHEQSRLSSRKIHIDAPSIHLPDIRLRSGRVNILTHESLGPMRERMNQIFQGENSDQLLDEISLEINRGKPLDQIRNSLIGKYPLPMIDLVLLTLSFVERDVEAGLITHDQVPQYLAKVLDDNRIMYITAESDISLAARSKVESSVESVSINTQTALPAGGQTKYAKFPVATVCPSKCFSCATEKKVTVPMSHDCIQILEGLQQVPLGQLSSLAARISDRMRVMWELDRTNSSEATKVIKKVLPKLRSGQVASLLLLRNDLKNEHLKYFYVVDPCIDVIQTLAEKYDLSKGVKDAYIDAVLQEVGNNYGGVGLLYNSKCPWNVSWVFQPTNLRNLIDKTEQRILTTSCDSSLPRKRRKLIKIITEAYTLMAKRHVGNTTELRNQLHRLYPKDSQLVEYVICDIEEGLRSGRLQHECGRCSIRILINIMHSKDVESCRIDGSADRLLGDRACANLEQNKHLLASSIRKLILDLENRILPSVGTAVDDEPKLNELIEYALDQIKEVKSFEELKELISAKSKHASTAELISLLLEQAYFANELENPEGKDTLLLMRDRMHGKPLVLREICFALPDHSMIQCKDHRDNFALTSSPVGKLVSVGQGLTWREANERARILFYRGRKPAVRYNDLLEGFDVRMLLEQDGCVHEIPVGPDDVRRLLNSCGLYWDGLNISLLGKSDEILRRAEEEAFKILRETGFLYQNNEAGTAPSATKTGPESEPAIAISSSEGSNNAEDQSKSVLSDSPMLVESDR